MEGTNEGAPTPAQQLVAKQESRVSALRTAMATEKSMLDRLPPDQRREAVALVHTSSTVERLDTLVRFTGALLSVGIPEDKILAAVEAEEEMRQQDLDRQAKKQKP